MQRPTQDASGRPGGADGTPTSTTTSIITGWTTYDIEAGTSPPTAAPGSGQDCAAAAGATPAPGGSDGGGCSKEAGGAGSSPGSSSPHTPSDLTGPEPPPEYICPISLDIMRLPVVLVSTGQIYDRRHIERWLRTRTSCPCTGQELQRPVVLKPHRQLRREIGGWVAANMPWALEKWKKGSDEKEEAGGPLLGAGPQGGAASGPQQQPLRVRIVSLPGPAAAGSGSQPPAAGAGGEQPATRSRACRLVSWLIVVLVILLPCIGMVYQFNRSSGDSGGGSTAAPRSPSPSSPAPAPRLTGASLTGPNATSTLAGTIELSFSSGGRGFVCDSLAGNGSHVRQVACRGMGLGGGFYHPPANASRTASYWILFCQGSEASLSECTLGPVSTLSATQCRALAAACAPARGKDEIEDVWLLGKGGGGVLEVLHDGAWGSVCASQGGFTSREASIVCRQLGLGSAGVASTAAAAGADYTSSRVWLNGVGCSGREGNLSQCAHSVWGGHTCRPGDEVYISCR